MAVNLEKFYKVQTLDWAYEYWLDSDWACPFEEWVDELRKGNWRLL